MLKNFKSTTDSAASSLWDMDFHSEIFTDQFLSTDKNMLEAFGNQALCRWMGLHGLRMASIARVAELGMMNFEKEKETMLEEKKELAKKMNEMSIQRKGMEKSVRLKNEKIKELENELAELKTSFESEKEVHKASMVAWNAKQGQWKKMEEELKGDLANQMVFGFNNCKAQVQVLYPNLDLSMLDVMKEVRGGAIVLPSDSEEDYEDEGHAEDNASGN